MIDVDRILALAAQPTRTGSGRGRDADRMAALAGLAGRRKALARPVAWSAALCAEHAGGTGLKAPGGERAAARVCRACPIRKECFAVPVSGAPPQVRAWREQLDE
ncbi:hypothetical protein GCM10022403_098940 [Streptomyces coacervatus]|uniref:4Fe-4S Wbl-type domain-containing protein n=1 Tax=Streptomyces coacervatus TaxID=647381 RepID=A0ABP7JRZ6_9ACTN|nr:hypothetical protein [Streptomyces coacervatus]MDF2263868.1 hypothetical protein [Streptomyces coacervatus]